MEDTTIDRTLLAMGVCVAISVGCSSEEMTPSDGGIPGSSEAAADVGTDLGVDIDTANPVACRVALDDPLNPCGSTSLEQELRYRGTDFAVANGCALGIVYQTTRPDHVWDCTYTRDGQLVAWDRIESTQLCDGRARAVVADAWSQGQLQSCLRVDAWTWILGFDPGPTKISVRFGTPTTGSTAKLGIGFGFTLSGGEVADSDLTLRYWYTADARGNAAPPQSTSCDGANGLICALTTISLVQVTPPRPMADTYAEVGFIGSLSTGFPFEYGFSINRTDGALYDTSNDYSSNGATPGSPTMKITAYVKGALIYGTEP